jgi:aspartate carbamoyltransferase
MIQTIMKKLGNKSSFVNSDILSVAQFTKEGLENVFATANKMAMIVKHPRISNLLHDKLLSTIFYEPSTRTSASFQAAMHRLGGQVIAINDVNTLSVSKGETLSDTLHAFESYSDVIVMRHYDKQAPFIGAKALRIPLINAGNGTDEHPTQALLDMYTIKQELRSISGLKIGMVGDLKYGRSMHSLAQCAALFGNELYFISPESLRMPEEVLIKLQTLSACYYESTDLLGVLPKLDVLYINRMQKERFADPEAYEEVKHTYIIGADLLRSAKATLCLLHPMPRVTEISTDVDSDPRAAYFRQMRNGMFVRMALFALLFGRT